MKIITKALFLLIALSLAVSGCGEADFEETKASAEAGDADAQFTLSSMSEGGEQRTVDAQTAAVVAQQASPDVQALASVPRMQILVYATDDESCTRQKRYGRLLVRDTELFCIDNSDTWEQICAVTLENSVRPDFFWQITNGKAIIGETRNTRQALESVAKNGGAKVERIYWDQFNSSCNVRFRVQGMYQGTTVNEVFVGEVGGMLVGINDAALVLLPPLMR